MDGRLRRSTLTGLCSRARLKVKRPRQAQAGSIETVHEADRSRVIAEGEMDLSCVVALNHAMSEATAQDVPIDLDLSGVTFVDSRFTAAVGGWERDLGSWRFRLELPRDARLERLLALRAQAPSRFRPRSVGESDDVERSEPAREPVGQREAGNGWHPPAPATQAAGD
jgi:hypothetical protein